MEELWEYLGNKEFLSLSPWLEYDEKLVNIEGELEENYIKSILADIREITDRILKIKSPKSIQLFVSPNWKYIIFKEAIMNKDNLKKRIMQFDEIKTHGKEAINIALKLERTSEKIQIFDSSEKEFQILKDTQEFLKCECNTESIEVSYSESSTNEKAKVAEPMKPGIYIEI